MSPRFSSRGVEFCVCFIGDVDSFLIASFSCSVTSKHFFVTSERNIPLDVGYEEIISAASVTYCWTTDVGAGLGVNKLGVASEFFLSRTVFCGCMVGSGFAVVDVGVVLDGSMP